jgi:hypothetical protein
MADLMTNQGPVFGRIHASVASEIGTGAQGKPVVRRSDEDSPARAYYLLWLAVKRVFASGVSPDELSSNQIATLQEWMNHSRTHELADAGDEEVISVLSGANLVQ